MKSHSQSTCKIPPPLKLRIDVQIQVDYSNYKINTYEKNAKGKLIRDKTSLPAELKANTCTPFETVKAVNPCKSNFWQVKIQGSLYNKKAENGYVYKDKNCESFKYDTLPKIDAESKPSSVPSVSVSPTGSPSVSTEPSAAPIKRVRPTKADEVPSGTIVSTEPTPAPTRRPTKVDGVPSGSKGKGKGKGKGKKGKNGGRRLRN